MDDKFKSSQDFGQKIEESLIRFAEAWRSGNWLRVITTILGYWLICFSPFLISEILKKVADFTLPGWLLWGWMAVGLVLFILAIVFAFRLKRIIPPPPSSSIIRGLLPFEREDAETFEKLGRSIALGQSLTVLKSSAFRFGILHGASGCGKTSFLRAGVLPRLNKPESEFRSVYVEFTNRDPLQTIREALIYELKPTEELPATTDLTVLFQAAAGVGKPLVLLFDQFEQVFFQRQQQLDSDPFFLALRTWYQQRTARNHRILLCWRRDYYYQSTDLLKMLGGSIGFQELFSLEKFTPEQATEVFSVMADEAGLAFEPGFVSEMITNELAEKETEEGITSLKVSPVSMQILAWLIAGQQTTDARASNRTAFRELGGVDGLMERFLRRVLEGRGAKGQTDVKVLLALTNRDTKTRAGLLHTGAIQEKDKTLSKEEIEDSLAYLASPNARLIIRETVGCKLAHERLISALLKVAGIVLGPQEQANQLLNWKLSLWEESRRDSRFLLGLSEWLAIKRYKASIIWGNPHQEANKRTYLKQSFQYWQQRLGVGVVILFLIATGFIWLQSTWGQVWQMERTLNQINNSGSEESKMWTIQTLAAIGRPIEALAAINNLSNSNKADLFPQIAAGFAELKDTAQAKTVLAKALANTDNLNDNGKAGVLSQIATSFTQLKDTVQAKTVLAKALDAADNLNDNDNAGGLSKIRVLITKVNLLCNIATSFTQLKDTAQAKIVLAKALDAADNLSDSDKAEVLPRIAASFAQLGHWHSANHIIKDEISSNEAKAIALYQVLIIRYYKDDPKRQKELLNVLESY